MADLCTVCGGKTTVLKTISGDFLKRSLAAYFGTPMPEGLEIRDYDLVECLTCSIVSAAPMIPGDDEFYSWITRQQGYYPTSRWEWGVVLERVRNAASTRPVSILDVGCGSGDFLVRAREVAGVEAFGLDMTEASVQAAQKKGLNVVCADLAQYGAQNPGASFDFVTSFHCVEHVKDPKQFLSEIKPLLKVGAGVALISAPLSPMSFEREWFDPLNYPPHHMTRWSIQAVEALGKAVGLRSDVRISPAGSSVSRALRALELSKAGALGAGKRSRQVGVALRHFPGFLREYSHQRRRAKWQGDFIGDIFLAEYAT